MAYKASGKKYKLTFGEDTDFEGLEVRAKGCSTGDFLRLASLAENLDPKNMDLEEIGELFTLFAGCIVEWNIEDDDDVPVPTTKDGLLSLDIDLVLAVLTAWMEAVAGVSGPKEKPSNDGLPLKAVSMLPQEAL